MSKKNKDLKEQPVEELHTQTDAEEASAAEAPAEDALKEPSEAEKLQKQLDEEHDRYLRLAAEYDNFRKRSQKEREALYTDVKAETVAKLLPIYDDLARALEQASSDEAYKKGVELIMNNLQKNFKSLGVEEFGAAGEPFDPNAHNAVLHIESEDFGENVIAEVFQRGFRIGEKVIRFAVVKVAN